MICKTAPPDSNTKELQSQPLWCLKMALCVKRYVALANKPVKSYTAWTFLCLGPADKKKKKTGSTQMSLSQWWCDDTRIVLWSHRCRSWSRGSWASVRYSAQCYCGLVRAGSSSQLCVNPSSTSWWFVRPAAAHSPPCGWKHPECGVSVAHWDPHLLDRKHKWGWAVGRMCYPQWMVFPTDMSGFDFFFFTSNWPM